MKNDSGLNKGVVILIIVLACVFLYFFIITHNSIGGEKVENEVAGYVKIDFFDPNEYIDRKAPTAVIQDESTGGEVPQAVRKNEKLDLIEE